MTPEDKIFYEALKLLEIAPTDFKEDFEWRHFVSILEIAQEYVDKRIASETKPAQCGRCNHWNCRSPVPITLSDILDEYV